MAVSALLILFHKVKTSEKNMKNTGKKLLVSYQALILEK